MRRRSRCSVWVPGVNFRDRLALWGMAKLPPNIDLGDHNVLAQVCAHFRYPLERCLQVKRDYPEAWNWLEWKRYLTRTRQPDTHTSPGRARAGRVSNMKRRHKRMKAILERELGCPIEMLM